MSMSIDKVIEILDSGKAPENEQDFIDFDTAIEAAINLLKTHPDSQPNDPLTLEQLREMDREPVWVEIPENNVAEWCISTFYPLMGRMRLWCSGGGWFDGKNCGKSVFVYRRKPEEKAT